MTTPNTNPPVEVTDEDRKLALSISKSSVAWGVDLTLPGNTLLIAAHRHAAVEEAVHYLKIDHVILQDIKVALRRPGTTGSYVEWAKECRTAVDQLADAQKRVEELERDLRIMTNDRNGVMEINERHRADLRAYQTLVARKDEALRNLLTNHSDGDIDAVSIAYDNMMDEAKVAAATAALNLTIANVARAGDAECDGKP